MSKSQMPYIKKSLLVAVATLFCSPSLLAAEAATGTQESLQQQLQALQESLSSSNKTADSAKTIAANAQNETNAVKAAPVAESNNAAFNGETSNTAPAAASDAATADSTTSTEGALEGNDLRSQAFGKVLTNTLPLSPSQIRMLRNMYDATQQAAVSYPGTPPRPTASSVVVNLSPGATPPVIRLGAGFVTSLVFVDSTGAPWPIDSYSLGNPTAFNIQWDKKSNILLVQAITAHRLANMAVLLKGLNTPVMVDLSPGQAAMDVRVDLRIPGLGPQAKPAFDALPGTESPALLALLDGVPPQGAKSLKSSACENCAWVVNKKLYLRTQFTVLSPAWISTMSSADGTHVYEMELTPLVLASYNGKTIKMRIEGF